MSESESKKAAASFRRVAKEVHRLFTFSSKKIWEVSTPGRQFRRR